MSAAFERDGFVVVDRVVDESVCDELLARIERHQPTGAGSRSLLRDEKVASVADALREHPSIAALLPVDAVAVQCTLFSKSDEANWSVAPHQDISIPVARRIAADACSGWSMKDDGWYVQPPNEVLETLTAVRVQLDPDSAGAGRLRVAAGSHRAGRIDAREAPSIGDAAGWTSCVAHKGAAVVMRPLLVHASSKSARGISRRVLHFLFGPRTLPLGLEWPARLGA